MIQSVLNWWVRDSSPILCRNSWPEINKSKSDGEEYNQIFFVVQEIKYLLKIRAPGKWWEQNVWYQLCDEMRYWISFCYCFKIKNLAMWPLNCVCFHPVERNSSVKVGRFLNFNNFSVIFKPDLEFGKNLQRCVFRASDFSKGDEKYTYFS